MLNNAIIAANIEILQRFELKTLRLIWYVTNEAIHRDLRIPTVKEEISKFSNRYDTHAWLSIPIL